ncbi:polysaccharide deacetylase family protein [Streptomyces sp. NPDC047017]|uniref:polysaccharide deacetylase family protein n=1 Tax=Streptomyces sp. NPDC047017 TaxID=3155024 RepID=UPI0033E6F90D
MACPAETFSAETVPAGTVPADTVPRARPGERAGSVPWVAMYHSVGDRAYDPYRITVTPDRLARQLRWLRRHGLRGVPVRDLLAARARGAGRGLVGLTFDDGYADFVTTALPLLHRHACGATLFVLPGRLGGDNDWDPRGPRKPLLSADAVRHAAAEGVEIGSHGLTHVDLTRADDRTLAAEVTESRALLQELTGRRVDGFCYPYGTVDARTLTAVREAGYGYACAIDPGPLTGPHALPRLHIGQHDTAWRLHLKRRLHRLRRRPVEGV